MNNQLINLSHFSCWRRNWVRIPTTVIQITNRFKAVILLWFVIRYRFFWPNLFLLNVSIALNGTNFMSIFVMLLVSMSGSVLHVHIILDSVKVIGWLRLRNRFLSGKSICSFCMLSIISKLCFEGKRSVLIVLAFSHYSNNMINCDKM